MAAGLPGGDGAASRVGKVRGSPGKKCGSGCARASREHRVKLTAECSRACLGPRAPASLMRV